MKIYSGELFLMDINMTLDLYMAWSMNCIILDNLTLITTYSLNATTVEIHYWTTLRRVRFATWEVVQQSP